MFVCELPRDGDPVLDLLPRRAVDVLEAARGLETSWPVLAQLTYADPPPFDDAIAALERAMDEGG